MTDEDLRNVTRNFARWAAARAAQQRVAGLSKPVLFGAFSGVQEALEAESRETWTPSAFDDRHRKWCSELMARIAKNANVKRPPRISFGVAAKFLNVYIKTAFVIPSALEHASFIANVHPPIDNLFLASIRRKHRELVGSSFPEKGWKAFGERDYANVIAALRKVSESGCDLWRLERDWTGL